MITRKENLLVRPFQQKKYIEHRQKVITALPRIDDVTPPKRNHVHIKYKKMQREAERHSQIERDNFILLKHLYDIMKVKRVDNIWLYEHPKFLRRIKLFHHIGKTSIDTNNIKIIEQPKNTTKKEKCIACHPENYIKTEMIPEERVPWEIKPVKEFYSTNFYENSRSVQSFPSYGSHLNVNYYRGVANKKKEILKSSSSKITFHATDMKNSTISNSKLSFKRSASAPPLKRKPIKQNSTIVKPTSLPDEQSLTVVIRFPPIAQVTLNAGISDKIV